MMKTDYVAVELSPEEFPDLSCVGKSGKILLGHAKMEESFIELNENSLRRWVIGSKTAGALAYAGISEAIEVCAGYCIWLLPLNSFEKFPVSGVKTCRKFINVLQEKTQKRLWCFVDVRYPERLKLVELLGFKQSHWQFLAQENIHMIYIKEIR